MKRMKERNNEPKQITCILSHTLNLLRLQYIDDQGMYYRLCYKVIQLHLGCNFSKI